MAPEAEAALETPVVAKPPPPVPRQQALRSYLDLEALFADLQYTPEAWMVGIRTVPRVFISQIPERWSKHTVNEIDVLTKKRLFFRVLGPLALRSNELILEKRERLVGFGYALDSGRKISEEDRSWLAELAGAYRLDPGQFDDRAALIDELRLRVDAIPVSLVLSQAAEESGWGTSRFAFSGNALFGQWTWGDDGIRPEAQRAGRGDYKIAAFDTPLQSVQAHARNLNTHPAYEEFRKVRAGRRQAREPLRGHDLVSTLTSYSERGSAYVRTLRTIMRANRLDAADEAYLAAMDPILLVPADD